MPPPIPSPSPVDLSQGVDAFVSHNWYAFAAVLLMLGIQIVRAKELTLWTHTPNGARFLWPIGLAMAAAFLHGFALGEPLKQAGMDVLNSLWQIALPAMGGAAALKESAIPWDGGAGGRPKRLRTPPRPKPLALAPDRHHGSPLIAEDDRPTPVDPGRPPPAA